MPIDRSSGNPQAIMRNNRRAQEAADARHSDVLKSVESVGDNLHADIVEGLKAMGDDLRERFGVLERKFHELKEENAELKESHRQILIQLGDISTTLKSVLPGLKTQQAGRPSSREEIGRQGS